MDSEHLLESSAEKEEIHVSLEQKRKIVHPKQLLCSHPRTHERGELDGFVVESQERATRDDDHRLVDREPAAHPAEENDRQDGEPAAHPAAGENPLDHGQQGG